ncbi:MAG: nitroreductase family protein [Bacteroidales bacterium]|jgi:nitroreductase|nr:nitroreductase family protein [Bacteroidales bacterium]
MNLRDIVIKNRSYRRFDENIKVEYNVLKELVDIARYTASARNIQPLKYAIVTDSDKCNKVFDTLAWAGYLKEWKGPEEGERPTGYIIMLGDTEITKNFSVDPGITAQTIMLGAVEKGLGGCIIMAVDKIKLREELNIPEHLDIIQVLAIGKPVEEVVVEDIINNDYKYHRDANGTHFVPKRKTEDIIIKL